MEDKKSPKSLTLKPYDRMIVLHPSGFWTATLFSHFNENGHPCMMDGKCYMHVIPFKGNECLVGKTGNFQPREDYVYWED